MAKYYVESGKLRRVITAGNAEEAAVKAVQLSCDERDTVHTRNPLEGAHYPLSDAVELRDEILVSERGFGCPQAVRFDTLDMVAIWQGYAFPWDESESYPTGAQRASR
jgi:hypothetical protein